MVEEGAAETAGARPDSILDAHDAVGLAGLVAAGELSPEELLDLVISRIERRNPSINAFVSTRFEQARDEVAAGLPDGPLRGVPFAVKDLGCDLAGLPTTRGSRLFADAIATEDGTLAKRYRRAGLVLVGKTNTPEFGKNASTEPALHGATRNPWNRDYSAGGSSGGSAAAVAGGLIPAAHGNDGGGSIRIPAACCGLFGLKPTRARVPSDASASAFAYPLAVNHALTRTVRDSAALLDIAAGPAAGDAFFAPAFGGRYADAVQRPPQALRIALTTSLDHAGPTAYETVEAVERYASLLETLGHHVCEAAPKWDARAMTGATSTIMCTATRVGLEMRLAELGRELRDGDVEPFTAYLDDAFRSTSAADFARALQHVEIIGRQFAPFFDDYDVWLSPTVPVPVPALGTLDTQSPEKMFANAPAMVTFTSVFNVSGLPAASVPAGFNADGLPLAVQLGAQQGREDLLLSLSAQLEQAAPWPWQAPWAADLVAQ